MERAGIAFARTARNATSVAAKRPSSTDARCHRAGLRLGPREEFVPISQALRTTRARVTRTTAARFTPSRSSAWQRELDPRAADRPARLVLLAVVVRVSAQREVVDAALAAERALRLIRTGSVLRVRTRPPAHGSRASSRCETELTPSAGFASDPRTTRARPGRWVVCRSLGIHAAGVDAGGGGVETVATRAASRRL